jgi:hypothetical protein
MRALLEAALRLLEAELGGLCLTPIDHGDHLHRLRSVRVIHRRGAAAPRLLIVLHCRRGGIADRPAASFPMAGLTTLHGAGGTGATYG